MTLLQKLQEEHPLRDVAFTAVETLKDPTEIKEFFTQYVEHLKNHSNSERIIQNPESVAGTNIGYILEYYDKKTAYIWMKTISSVTHPLFGRNISHLKGLIEKTD